MIERTLAEIYRPFSFQVNAELESARDHVLSWVDGSRLTRSTAWRAIFDAADFGYFVALVHPDIDRIALELAVDWFAWLFLVDDELDDGTVGRDLAEAGELAEQVCAVLRAEAYDGDRGDTPLLAALADLWRRTAPRGSALWRARFTDHLTECLRTAAIWEAGNRVRGIVPDRDTYVERRRHTGAIYVCMDLVEALGGFEVTAEQYRGADFSGALDAACDVVCWTNDVYSLAKEQSFGEVHNLAYIIGHHERLDEAEALARVCAEIDTRVRRFLELERALRDRSAPEPVLACLDGMRSWMRGNFDWSSRTARYSDIAGPLERGR
ncbi:hypothetical protein OHB26_12260 [Nocardia sp. NBC_01503]|uniref:terpene synthase family protein n=1 Tax=Nocardia sp. NBC_01503 TaxID=2975997 RepID=UPI002E7C0B4B|nr:hypothetical protein [Nocardia sp. NBC_01503]WTL34893.1 hypothetical protein OHB26_12260 [Nocardia sp. NBC_01503]